MPKRTNPYLIRAAIHPDADVDYNSFPFSIPAVREIGSINFRPNVTFFVGENGAGKSTVLEGIAVALGFGTEGGLRMFAFGRLDRYLLFMTVSVCHVEFQHLAMNIFSDQKASST